MPIHARQVSEAPVCRAHWPSGTADACPTCFKPVFPQLLEEMRTEGVAHSPEYEEGRSANAMMRFSSRVVERHATTRSLFGSEAGVGSCHFKTMMQCNTSNIGDGTASCTGWRTEHGELQGGITVDEVGFDRSVKQGGKESPTLSNMVMRCWLRPLSAVWKEQRQGHKTQSGTQDEDDELLISHMICMDNCYILTSRRRMLLEIAQSATNKSYNAT